jgi:ferredoxin-NADP reductase
VAVVRKIPCAVARVTHHGERVYTVELQPAAPVPRFRPGQFLHLALDEYEPGGFWPESRVFSIASSPGQRDRLAITYAVKGPFTARMEEELTEDRRVWVKLPYGDFFIDASRDAVLLAGGTGVTAFTAFLESMEAEQEPRVLLFYGARTHDLFVYGPLAEARAREVPTFTCRLVDEASRGVLSIASAWRAIERLDDPAFYLSGPPEMLVALTKQLLERGVAEAAVHTDAWE